MVSIDDNGIFSKAYSKQHNNNNYNNRTTTTTTKKKHIMFKK